MMLKELTLKSSARLNPTAIRVSSLSSSSQGKGTMPPFVSTAFSFAQRISFFS